MTSPSSGSVEVAGLAAAEHQHLHRQLARGLEVGGVGDDLGDAAEPDRPREVGVGRHQDGDRAEPRQRGDGDQRAGPGLHQHTDAVALAHTDLDQAAHDVVDAAVDRLVGVHAAVEQQELAVGCVVGLLVDDAAQRDAGVVVDLAEPGQPRQRAGGLHGQRRASTCWPRRRRSAAPRASDTASPEASPTPCIEPRAQRHPGLGRVRRAAPPSARCWPAGAPGRTATAPSRRPSATSSSAALDPTTRPKCPARIMYLVDVGVRARRA